MTRTYLIRHGETDWNRAGLCMGQMDIPLNELGHRQAELTAERLASLGIDAVYSSDLVRALETARPIAARHGLTPVALKELRELHYGRWQGHSHEEIERLFPQAFRIGPPEESIEFQPEGGESRYQLYQRSVRAFEEIWAKHRGQTVVLVTHGGVIRCLVNYVLQRDSEQNKGIFYSRGFLCDNCGITLIESRDDGHPRVKYLNDRCHLESLDALDR